MITINILILLLIFGCTYEIKPYPYTQKQVYEEHELEYDKQGVSATLRKRLMSSPQQIDCINPNNYNKSSLYYEFYINSKWLPSTQEGTFDGDMARIRNTGCTNLFLESTTYIIFNSTVVHKFEMPCSSQPVRPTDGTVGGGMFIEGIGFIANQTGKYIVQKEFKDCKKNITLIKRAVVIDMGNINKDFYNKVDYTTPVDIKDN